MATSLFINQFLSVYFAAAATGALASNARNLQADSCFFILQEISIY
jgi:hypothetical protein